MGDFFKLDDNSLDLVLSSLDLLDLARVQATCRYLNRKVNTSSSLLWLRKLSDEFGLDTSLVKDLDYLGTFQRIKSTPVETIRFQGLYTNGGVDIPEGVQSPKTYYWVDNAFRNDESPYCSLKTRDVDIVGVLLHGHQSLIHKEEEQREYMMTRTASAVRWLQRMIPDISSLGFNSDLQLRSFFLSLLDAYEQGNGLGPTMFVDLMTEERTRYEYFKARAFRASLLEEAKRLEKSVVEMSGLMYDKGLLGRLQQGPNQSACIVQRLSVERQGGLTCPVQMGVIFGCISSDFGQPSNDDSPASADQKTWVSRLGHSLTKASEPFKDVLDGDMLVGRFRRDLLPNIESINLFVENNHDRSNQLHGSYFVEFERTGTSAAEENSSFNWGVIGYFCFNCCLKFYEELLTDIELTGRKVTTRITGVGDEVLKKVSVNLVKARTMNLVAIKLIGQENLMEEFQDHHESPNIDISGCIIQGQAFEISSV
jgi:hypothetical protein